MKEKMWVYAAVFMAAAFVVASSSAQQDSTAGQQGEKLAAVELTVGEFDQLAVLEEQVDEKEPRADLEKSSSVSEEEMGVPMKLSSVRQF